MFNIVLVEPEIPQNTGNISRTCAVTGCRLHLVRPLGFSVNDRYLKRAGLDYWNELEIFYYDSFSELEQKYPDARFFLFSTHAEKHYAEVSYRPGDFLVFGKETAGLGPELLSRRSEDAVRIPMRKTLRSLNLSNSVAIAVYEALRQNGFGELV
ncbi:MAG: tRNA (cytidine(34)-2'-O)-methyltransferase [Clostridia bacterium]|nr:tRNA (cytidine(34)-2'-O)-methyltransferase [Clostridia bacterium]